MENIMFMTIMLFIFVGSCHGQCSNVTTAFRSNSKTLVDLLIKNAPLHNGFYETSVGNNSDQVFGVFQCKANISSNDCANCLNSSRGSLDVCAYAESLSTFCTKKVSSKNLTGIWSNFSTASFGVNGLDDPSVFSKGFSMMQELAGAVPDQPLMYQAAGIDGKRYGLAQCARDLSKLNCQNCLEDRLMTYRSYVNNRTGWEILGVSCSMWYSHVSNDYTPHITALTPSESQSPPGRPTVISGSGEQRYHRGIRIVTILSIALTTFTLLFATQVFNTFNHQHGIRDGHQR